MIPIKFVIALFLSLGCFLNYIFEITPQEKGNAEFNAVLYGLVGAEWIFCLFKVPSWYVFVISILTGVVIGMVYFGLSDYAKNKYLKNTSNIEGDENPERLIGLIGHISFKVDADTYVGKLDDSGDDVYVQIVDEEVNEGDEFVIASIGEDEIIASLVKRK